MHPKAFFSAPLLLLFAAGCASNARGIAIPRLHHISIDGVGADWGSSGYRVEIFSDNADAPSTPADAGARMRLGWDERGIVVLLDVKDDRTLEADDSNDLASGDSVEFYVYRDREGLAAWEGRVSPGVDPHHPELRTKVSPKEMRLYPSPRRVKPQFTAARTRVNDGYVLEALLPFSNLGITAAEGKTIALQVVINDFDAPGKWRQLRWFPRRWDYRERNLYTLRLAGKPDSPQELAASAEIENLRRLRVRIDATRHANDSVELRDQHRVLAGGKLTGHPTASAELTCALPAPPAGLDDLRVAVARSTTAPVVVPDLDLLRQAAFLQTPVRFNSFVFSSAEFPTPFFDNPGAVEDMIGRFRISATFYDAGGAVVTRADKHGRYGAVVECRTEDGRSYRKYCTLFRAPKALKWRERLKPDVSTMPAALGIDPRVLAEQREEVSYFLGGAISESFWRDTQSGALLSWLYEIKPGAGPASASFWPDAVNDRYLAMLRKKHDELRYPYYLQLPRDYDRDHQTRWPMILYLHGAGERGVDMGIVRRSPLPARIALRPDLPFIVISPQCPPAGDWSIATLDALLDEVLAKYRVDADRVYLTGYSMGGFASWGLAAAHPGRFAAVVPICGGWDPHEADRVKDIPFWVFHGDKDPTVPLEESQRMVDALRKLHGRIRFTVYPGVGHDSWVNGYEEDDLYPWLLRQKRGLSSEPRYQSPATTKP